MAFFIPLTCVTLFKLTLSPPCVIHQKYEMREKEIFCIYWVGQKNHP